MNLNKSLTETLELDTRPRAYSNSSSSSSSLASPISSTAPWTTSPVGSSNLMPSSRRPSIGINNTGFNNGSSTVANTNLNNGSGLGPGSASGFGATATDPSVSPRKSSVGSSSPAVRTTSFRSAHAQPRGTNSGYAGSSPPLAASSKNATLNPNASLNSNVSLNSSVGGGNGSKTFYKPPAKPKESALSKAKMFALQATKPHLSANSNSNNSHNISSISGNINSINSNIINNSQIKGTLRKTTLTIQPIPQLPRTSISERSPLTRPSKELERIALLGSQSPKGGPGYPDLASTASIASKHKPHYHLPFRPGKNTHGSTVLSSSSSNSKLVSEQGSIYSFHPSSPGGIHKSLSALELKNSGKDFDRDQIADEAWTLLKSRVLPLYQGEGLRIPVEDLNDLVTMHLNFRIHGGAQASAILSEFQDLSKLGMLKLHSALQKVHSSPSKFLPRLVQVWQFFFSQVLPYWEAVFLPLQLELDCRGQLLSPHSAKEYWSTVFGSSETVTIRQMTLTAFRDWVLIPVADKLMVLLTQSLEDDLKTDELDSTANKGTEANLDGTENIGDSANTNTNANRSVADAAVRLFQCTSILASIRSNDENQQIVDSLVKAIKNTWLIKSRSVQK